MNETVGPATYHIMLRTKDAADFRRAGAIRLDSQPPQGTALDIEYDGRALRGLIEAVFIPPGCEENCIGTLFLAET
jgi:hypothetical protein